MTFCRSEAIDCGELFGLLNRLINLSPIEFDKVYDQFRGSFRQKSGPPKLTLKHDFIRKPLSLVEREFKPAKVAVYPGIDLPCWIEMATNAPLIILLGQDSLRDDSYFREHTAEPYVVIGTPHGVHSRAFWDYRNSPRYWAVICYLLNKGYNLYLTDVFKFWYEDVTRAAAEKESYRSILEQEFKVVGAYCSDTIVVAFGKIVAEFLLDADWAWRNISNARAEIFPGKEIRGIRVLPVMHPSRNTEPRLRDYLPANGVDPNAYDPKKRVAGIGEVIVRAIASATGREPERGTAGKR